MSNRWKIVLVATFFNLLFEYSLRGFADLVTRPLLPIFIFPIYFTWFSAMEDLIGRFKLKDYQVALMALIFGLINTLFFIPAKYIYAEPLILGFNWGDFLWIFLVWWIFLQAILALYIGHRVFPRKSSGPLLGVKGWIAIVSMYIVFGTLFRLRIKASFPTLLGAIVSIFLILISIVLFIYSIRKSPAVLKKSSKSVFIDIISLITIIIFIALAVLSPGEVKMYDYHPISYISLTIVVFWTTIAALAFYFYRFFSRKSVLV